MAPRVGPVLLKARIYSATLGRFLQTDPIGYGDGMNMYGYVGGDPVNATDPSGNATCTIVTGSRIPVCSSQAVDLSSLGFAKSYGGGGGGATIRFKITSAIVCVGTSCSTPTVSDWTIPTMNFGNDTSGGSYGAGLGIGGLLGDVGGDIVVTANNSRNGSRKGSTGQIPDRMKFLTIEQLDEMIKNPSSPAERKEAVTARKLKQQIKQRGGKNILKRSLKISILPAFIFTCLVSPVTCALMDKNEDSKISLDEI